MIRGGFLYRHFYYNIRCQEHEVASDSIVSLQYKGDGVVETDLIYLATTSLFLAGILAGIWDQESWQESWQESFCGIKHIDLCTKNSGL